MSNSIVLGVDIGGSHITTALIDLKNIAIIPETMVRKSVDSQKSTEVILELWATALSEAANIYNISLPCVGIAMPGPFNYEEGICQIKNQDKYDALFGLNIKKLLAQKLNISPETIKFINDAGAFLQGEVFAGAGRDYQGVIGVTLGTGLGTSRYHDGLAADANLWCMPFKDGIAEDYLSTRWFVKRYEEVSGVHLPDAKSLADLADTDNRVKAVFEEFGFNLGLFLSQFIQMDKPEVVVLGGNITHASDLFLAATQSVLASQNQTIGIKKAKLGEEAALIGAASTWHNEISKPSLAVK